MQQTGLDVGHFGTTSLYSLKVALKKDSNLSFKLASQMNFKILID